MKKPVPDFLIKLDADDTIRFIDAVTKALCNGWSRAPDIPAQPDRPAIYRFIRERPGLTTAAINFQRTDSETIQLVRLVSKIKPLSDDECRALLDEFNSSILDKVRQTGLEFQVLICDEIYMDQLMDAKAYELLQHFAAHADKEVATAEYYDRDRFQQFLIRLHRTEHRVTAGDICLWAMDQGFPEHIAAKLGWDFRFGMQFLGLYDGYLEYRQQCNPDLP